MVGVFYPHPDYYKDPQAVLDYGWRWQPKWIPDGDTIVVSTWTVSGPDNLLTTADPQILDSNQTVVWLSGGTVDADYTVTNHIETQNGRKDDRSFVVHVTQR